MYEIWWFQPSLTLWMYQQNSDIDSHVRETGIKWQGLMFILCCMRLPHLQTFIPNWIVFIHVLVGLFQFYLLWVFFFFIYLFDFHPHRHFTVVYINNTILCAFLPLDLLKLFLLFLFFSHFLCKYFDLLEMVKRENHQV